MTVNSTAAISRLTDSMQVVWCVLFGIESFLIIACNVTAITIFMKKKFRVSKSCYLIINLTVADVLVGVSAFITLIEIWHEKGTFFTICSGIFLSELSLNFSLFTLLASLTSLAMMAVERALAILIPFRFRRVSGKHYFRAILLSWCVSLALFLRHFACSSEITVHIFSLYFMFFMIASIVVIIISYSAIAIKRVSSSELNSNISMRNNLRLSRTLMLTTLVALITWVPPYMILSVSADINVSYNTALAMGMLIYSNSLANLLVYTVRMPQFRLELKKMFGFNNKVTHIIVN